MDAIEFLTKDHEAVKTLLAAANTYDQMKGAFGEISRILETHTYLEERFFYPNFENHEHLGQLIQEAREQHDLVKQLLEAMKHQNGQEFEKNFQTLRAEVQLHMTSEEGEIFPQAQSSTDHATLVRLGSELVTAKTAYENGSEISISASPR
jgi:hemerythrin superfamily protein